jgi:hypothetical protein
MLLELQKHYPDLKMGRYFHTAGSLHCYEQHYDLNEKMLNEHSSKKTQWINGKGPRAGEYRFVEPMAPLTSLEELDRLMEFEKRLRVEGFPVGISPPFVNPTIKWMADQLVQHRKKRDQE